MLFRGDESNTTCDWTVHRHWINSDGRHEQGEWEFGSPVTYGYKADSKHPRAVSWPRFPVWRGCVGPSLHRRKRGQGIGICGDPRSETVLAVSLDHVSIFYHFISRWSVMLPRRGHESCAPERTQTGASGRKDWQDDTDCFRQVIGNRCLRMLRSGAVIPSGRG